MTIWIVSIQYEDHIIGIFKDKESAYNFALGHKHWEECVIQEQTITEESISCPPNWEARLFWLTYWGNIPDEVLAMYGRNDAWYHENLKQILSHEERKPYFNLERWANKHFNKGEKDEDPVRDNSE